METLKAYFDLTATEIRAAIITVVGAIFAGVTFVVGWAFRIDGRVRALEADRDSAEKHNSEDHQRIEKKLDRLIEHLIDKSLQ